MNSKIILSTAAHRIAAQASLFITPAGLEVKRPSEFAPIVGQRGTMMDLDPKIIQIDTAAYQREANVKHFRKIATAWSWNSYQPISVSRRPDGSLWCFDGQHRLLAAQMRGDIAMLPCWVVEMAGSREEAGNWLAVNNERNRAKPIEEFKARAVAQDPAHKWFASFMANRGLRPSSQKKNLALGDCTAINCCVKALKKGEKHAAKRLIEDTFNILLLAWGDQPRCYSGRAVEGMLRLVSRLSAHNRAVLATHAKTRLGRYSVADILDAADASAKARNGAVLAELPMIFMDKFNFRQRTDLLVF